jgi:hypothetical protein
MFYLGGPDRLESSCIQVNMVFVPTLMQIVGENKVLYFYLQLNGKFVVKSQYGI